MTPAVPAGVAVLPPMIRPSWSDPQFMVASSAWHYTDVPLGAGTVSVIAAPNPKRWLLIVQNSDSPPGTVIISGVSDTPKFGWSLTTAFQVMRFSQFDYGSLVQTEWYASGSAGGNLRIIESYIL